MSRIQYNDESTSSVSSLQQWANLLDGDDMAAANISAGKGLAILAQSLGRLTAIADPPAAEFSRPRILTFKKRGHSHRQAVWLPRHIGFDCSVYDAMVVAQRKMKDIFLTDESDKISFVYKVGNDTFPLEYPSDAKSTILRDMFSLVGAGNTIELEYKAGTNVLPLDLDQIQEAPKDVFISEDDKSLDVDRQNKTD